MGDGNPAITVKLQPEEYFNIQGIKTTSKGQFKVDIDQVEQVFIKTKSIMEEEERITDYISWIQEIDIGVIKVISGTIFIQKCQIFQNLYQNQGHQIPTGLLLLPESNGVVSDTVFKGCDTIKTIGIHNNKGNLSLKNVIIDNHQ